MGIVVDPSPSFVLAAVETVDATKFNAARGPWPEDDMWCALEVLYCQSPKTSQEACPA